MLDDALLLFFACAILGLAMAAPRLAQQGDRRLLAAWAITTLLLTVAVVASAEVSSQGKQRAVSIGLLAVMPPVGSAFGALLCTARWRQRRRPAADGRAARATIGDVVLGVTVWIGAGGLAWMLTLLGLIALYGPTVR